MQTICFTAWFIFTVVTFVIAVVALNKNSRNK